ncbi:MAG: hypothetical protein COX29_03710 [Candidatus Moranbacteria bacterium CG23_combo_of_CG06-09_8_20_14_all_35_22]|nr:MAG: hypothetical protein COX29_03710 [Candidatus Moranbacteria bacterium CG23_combo_of_CG06-09_8_20_14_all_35_22]
MKKFLISISAIFFIIAIGLFFIFDANKEKIMTNPYIKSIVQKIADFIYTEAGKHNPQGDILPDKVDDDIIKEIKKKIN